MLHDRLALMLDGLASRYRQLCYWQTLAGVWLLAAAAVLFLGQLGISVRQYSTAVTTLAVCGSAGLLAYFWRWCIAAPPRQAVAQRIETHFPELESCLLTAIEQVPALPDGRFGFLQLQVIQQALAHADTYSWQSIVPRRRIGRAVLVQSLTLGLFIATTVLAPVRTPAKVATRGRQSISQSDQFSMKVEPGDTEIEQGSNLLVLARFSGPLPSEGTLVTQVSGAPPQRIPMSASLNDPVFGGLMVGVEDPFIYHVQLGTHQSPTYRISVFTYPRLERVDARLVYPSYTSLEPRVVADVRALSVVEGTAVTLICELNKPVQTARFVERPGSATRDSQTAPSTMADVPLVLRDGRTYVATLTPTSTRRLKLELIDAEGRANADQVEIVIQVVPNQPPTLKLAFPGRDLEVSPLEELDVKATAWDDFGLQRVGIHFAIAGQPPTDVVLSEKGAPRQRHELVNTIRLEDLQAQPDQLLSYHLWAEDFGTDGQLRRTTSDLYFAEVRHFDEIFRQGQQPPGGDQQSAAQGNQNTQAAQQLAQLQKEISTATWNLIRRASGAHPPAAFVTDVTQIADSQATALEQATVLSDTVRDATAQGHLVTVLEAMQQAEKQLRAAQNQPSSAPLQPALLAEQTAYQALLKLRAREHEIIRQQARSQSRGASSSAAARSGQQRQQMDQLELKEEENRYETQRLAQSQQEQPADREARQVLNRLKELARRQHDLNERLKDLQSALQEAATPDKREDIRQQLKRLQEEQKEMLRDTDELQSRMDLPENQEQMAQERQQVQEAREQVQRASEALEKDQVTQAAAAGTRAEREFDELRNEFRRRAAGRFNEEVRQMREAARDLDTQEQKLAQQLAEATNPNSERKTLRDDNNGEQITRGLNQQQQRLADLTERLKQTVQEAEETEPLLTERLAEAARNLQDQNVERALDAASRTARQGLLDDAREVEKIAGRGIGQLRQGIEKAAEAVLGDETEALRRAREQLQNLAQELNQEIARNAPDEALPENAMADRTATPKQSTPESESTNEAAVERRPPRSTPSGAPQSERDTSTGPREGTAPSDKKPEALAEKPRQPTAEGRSPNDRPATTSASSLDGKSPQSSQQSASSGAPESRSQPGNGQRSSQPGSSSAGRTNGTSPNASTPNSPGSLNTGSSEPVAPIAGNDFLDWSDRLRDVEEMVDDPELRASAARIRDQARSIRADLKRHSTSPNWKLVRVNVAEPLAELANRVADELVRRNSKQAIVPLDRDPVPPRYSEKTRRYYERLGSGK